MSVWGFFAFTDVTNYAHATPVEGRNLLIEQLWRAQSRLALRVKDKIAITTAAPN